MRVVTADKRGSVSVPDGKIPSKPGLLISRGIWQRLSLRGIQRLVMVPWIYSRRSREWQRGQEGQGHPLR